MNKLQNIVANEFPQQLQITKYFVVFLLLVTTFQLQASEDLRHST